MRNSAPLNRLQGGPQSTCHVHPTRRLPTAETRCTQIGIVLQGESHHGHARLPRVECTASCEVYEYRIQSSLSGMVSRLSTCEAHERKLGPVRSTTQTTCVSHTYVATVTGANDRVPERTDSLKQGWEGGHTDGATMRAHRHCVLLRAELSAYANNACCFAPS